MLCDDTVRKRYCMRYLGILVQYVLKVEGTVLPIIGNNNVNKIIVYNNIFVWINQSQFLVLSVSNDVVWC